MRQNVHAKGQRAAIGALLTLKTSRHLLPTFFFYLLTEQRIRDYCLGEPYSCQSSTSVKWCPVCFARDTYRRGIRPEFLLLKLPYGVRLWGDWRNCLGASPLFGGSCFVKAPWRASRSLYIISQKHGAVYVSNCLMAFAEVVMSRLLQWDSVNRQRKWHSPGAEIDGYFEDLDKLLPQQPLR